MTAETQTKEIPASTRFLWRRDDWMRQVAVDVWLKPVDRLVGLYLALRMNAGTQSTWPNMITIGRELGISPHSVRRSIGKLKVEGWLRVTLTERRHNSYEIKMPDED